MKRAVIVFVIAGLVLASIALWILTSDGNYNAIDLVHFGVILVLVAFALVFSAKRLGSARRGEPAEDELSKRMMQKAAAISYFLSLYIWVFLLFLKDRISFDTEQLIGTGVLAMAVTFGLAWLIIYIRGIRNE